jgi:hypothetical protein
MEIHKSILRAKSGPTHALPVDILLKTIYQAPVGVVNQSASPQFTPTFPAPTNSINPQSLVSVSVSETMVSNIDDPWDPGNVPFLGSAILLTINNVVPGTDTLTLSGNTNWQNQAGNPLNLMINVIVRNLT